MDKMEVATVVVAGVVSSVHCISGVTHFSVDDIVIAL